MNEEHLKVAEERIRQVLEHTRVQEQISINQMITDHQVLAAKLEFLSPKDQLRDCKKDAQGGFIEGFKQGFAWPFAVFDFFFKFETVEDRMKKVLEETDAQLRKHFEGVNQEASLYHRDHSIWNAPRRKFEASRRNKAMMKMISDFDPDFAETLKKEGPKALFDTRYGYAGFLAFLAMSPAEQQVADVSKMNLRSKELRSLAEDIKVNAEIRKDLRTPDLVDTFARSIAAAKEKKVTWDSARQWAVDAEKKLKRGESALLNEHRQEPKRGFFNNRRRRPKPEANVTPAYG